MCVPVVKDGHVFYELIALFIVFRVFALTITEPALRVGEHPLGRFSRVAVCAPFPVICFWFTDSAMLFPGVMFSRHDIHTP